VGGHVEARRGERETAKNTLGGKEGKSEKNTTRNSGAQTWNLSWEKILGGERKSGQLARTGKTQLSPIDLPLVKLNNHCSSLWELERKKGSVPTLGKEEDAG